MNHLERFLAVMEYKPVDRVVNWEWGAWIHTQQRWISEGLDPQSVHWDWIRGEPLFGFDPREPISFDTGPLPRYEEEVLAEDDRTVTIRNTQGVVRQSLKEGSIGSARLSMDHFVDWPVHNMQDWQEHKRRFDPTYIARYEPAWDTIRLLGWRSRQHPLCLMGAGGTSYGFYGIAREWLGTEGLSLAFCDQPALIEEIMECWAEFLIEGARPILDKTDADFVIFAEDLAMKTGPLLSPDCYRRFMVPRMKKVIEFFKANGVKYIIIDSDGNPEALFPIWMDMGVDGLWPCERAANMSPTRLRKEYGKQIRLWGGVDKREIAKGPKAIDKHLRQLAPLIEEGGFIPTVDHSVPPDISLKNFQYYCQAKQKLLEGRL